MKRKEEESRTRKMGFMYSRCGDGPLPGNRERSPRKFFKLKGRPRKRGEHCEHLKRREDYHKKSIAIELVRLVQVIIVAGMKIIDDFLYTIIWILYCSIWSQGIFLPPQPTRFSNGILYYKNLPLLAVLSHCMSLLVYLFLICIAVNEINEPAMRSNKACCVIFKGKVER